jgi:hypothetical protein
MTAIVDLPTPPFLFAIARNRAIAPLSQLFQKTRGSYVIRAIEAKLGRLAEPGATRLQSGRPLQHEHWNKRFRRGPDRVGTRRRVAHCDGS